MAHDFVKNLFADNPQRLPATMKLAIAGGSLLLVASAVHVTGISPFHADLTAIAASVLLAFPLLREAARDLWRGRIHMNELAALGVVACMAAQEYLSAGAISFFMILSTLIEERSAHGARQSIASLVRLTPSKAIRLGDDSREEEIPSSELRPGTRFRLRPGDRIPADGRVESGVSACDQSTITGESIPVDKCRGDEVFAGTINLTGVIDVRVEKAGADTTLGQVQAIILAAEKSKPPVLRILDEHSGWYTPLVLMVAALVLFVTGELDRAISIVVIACPCSLILSASTASVAALGAASRQGILFKNVSNLETARNVSAVVFDKTGTLTEGRLAVDAIVLTPSSPDSDPFALAAALESRSRHPVALALVREAQERALALGDAVDQVREEAGLGMVGMVNGHKVVVGKKAWLERQGIPASPLVPPDDGIVLWVAVDGVCQGWITLRDTIRGDAGAVLMALRDLGIARCPMVTGDRQTVASEVARLIGCTELHADALPHEKMEVVRSLQREGHVVAVVGDGVNDAPALAVADLSIAMGAAGSDVAIHSASMALMNNHLDRIPFIISLSRRTTTVIRQNLAFSLSLIAIVIAGSALGLVHPVVAVALHTLSSVVVIFSSARILKDDPLPSVGEARHAPVLEEAQA